MTDKSTITMLEENFHALVLLTGEIAYDRCEKGQSWEDTKVELINAVMIAVHPMTDEDREELEMWGV